jgi:rod shape-determining protein MreC
VGTFKAKNLVFSSLVIVSIIIFSFVVPSCRPILRAVVRVPLIVLTALKNEAGGIIFYHRNMAQARRMAIETDLLKRKLVDAEEARIENARLRELLNLKKSSPYKVISAGVIGRSPSSWASSLIIDKGSANGIRKGYVCLGFLGLIGRVVEVSVSTSTVMLINDPNLCVSSLIQRSRQEGLVCGSLGGVLLMKYLTKDSDVKVSDTVLTSGLTDVFPKAIVVGTVIEVRDEMSGLSRYAVVRPAVNLSSVEEILVIIP